MVTSLPANPGQIVSICVQVTDGYGQLHDGYQAPTVDFFLMPSGSYASGYPVAMTEVSLGIWKHSFQLPTGISAVGTYIVSCSWPHPDTAKFQNEVYLIQCSLPFGNSSVSPG